MYYDIISPLEQGYLSPPLQIKFQKKILSCVFTSACDSV